ncbi:MAG: putative porin [Candidatus Aadella gelida]|nr:putative porin [Candidatus Aadella gelida]
MKKKLMIMVLVVGLLMSFCATRVWAGEMDILVNKLVEKGILTPHEGQILKSEAKEEAAKEMAEGKAIAAPEWTQKIKVKGDVRFRTQTDWGKGVGPAHQRTRQRVRARLGIEGKVNDQIKAGIQAVTGGNDPRSTNQTLDDNFETQDFRLEQYYIKWMPELDEAIGDMTVSLGKFSNPLNKTELLWDGDICPAGTAFNYMSPNFDLAETNTNLYANAAMFWLDEFGTSERDPLLWVGQAGFKMDVISDWGAVLDISGAYYDFANVQNNPSFRITTPVAGSQTNDFVTATNEYAEDFNLIDVLIKYDAKQIFDIELGNGLYGDLIWNTNPNEDGFAWLAGAYIGNKKPAKRGQWKVRGDYRYIERNAVPDFLPDSDFYGFDYTARGGNVAGTPSAGGTNGQGFNTAIEYAILKNTVLAAEYYYMWPIDVFSSANHYDEPYQLLQLDIRTKF